MEALTRNERKARRKHAATIVKRLNRERRSREALAASLSPRQRRNEIKLIRRARIFVDNEELQARVLATLMIKPYRRVKQMMFLTVEQRCEFIDARMTDDLWRTIRRA